VRYWRGALVIAFLAAWPLVWFSSSFSTFGFGGQCAIDNCGPEPTTIETIFYFLYLAAPPICVILAWGIWRAKSRKTKGFGDAT